MRLNILFGGKAGQGINKISEIVSHVLAKYGYFTFNYRDYQSLIRGGHNFNILSISDKWIASVDDELDGIIALDERTVQMHKIKLKKGGFLISGDPNLGRNLNIYLSGVVLKMLGIEKSALMEEIKKEFNNAEAIDSAEKGYDSGKEKFKLNKLANKMRILNGSIAIAEGAVNSKIDIYFAYPMTPATGVMAELAENQIKNNLLCFQPENEIACAISAIGASFAGARVMTGTSGGGFDLMTEALSLQGVSEIPLVVYLASRPGPGTGVPTYTSLPDIDVALRAGHGEFTRIVVVPGDPIECIEKTNEAFYLAEKFGNLSIILSDKHLAESEFSVDKEINKILKIEVKRKVAGEGIVRASSYEHDKNGDTIEDEKTVTENCDARIEKYNEIKKECRKFQMIKLHGKKDSKNLIISCGSTKGAILDAIDGLDCKFLQVLYLKPMSDEIRTEMEKAKNIILVEQNSTGQLGRLIREKTGIKIEKRILKYDGRPFYTNELKNKIMGMIK